MKAFKEEKKPEEKLTWEEESGLLEFLSSVNPEVEKFNASFEFGINNRPPVPKDIDGNTELPLRVGFLLERKNPLMSEFTYCLYSLLKNKMLYGYVGMYRNGSLQTLKELKPVKDFVHGKEILYDWMSQLVRASCEKRML